VVREVACLVIGAGIHLANFVDIVWTALGTHGGGPISGRVMAFVWKGVLALHKRWPRHRLMSFAGSAMVVMLLVLWISLVWLGWFVIFSANHDSLVDPHTRQPATIAGRFYFAGYVISTLGNGDYVPNGSRWQIATAIATVSGMGTLTLTITFLMNVLPAVVEQRMLAAYITDLGGTPSRILSRAWNGEGFHSLNDHLIALTTMIHLFTEQHLAYPVLHYFHGEKERTAPSLRIAALYELIVLMNHGVAEPARISPMVLLPLRDAMRGLREVISSEFVDPSQQSPAPPSISILRDLGIPTVDPDSYARAMRETDDSRRFFAGLVRDDGWPWERIHDDRTAPEV